MSSGRMTSSSSSDISSINKSLSEATNSEKENKTRSNQICGSSGERQSAPKAWYRRVLEGGGGGGGDQVRESRRRRFGKKQRDYSMIAHAGSNFVDKLTYMIKRSYNGTTFSGNAVQPEPAQSECLAANAQRQSNSSTTNNTNTSAAGNRYLLSELTSQLDHQLNAHNHLSSQQESNSSSTPTTRTRSPTLVATKSSANNTNKMEETPGEHQKVEEAAERTSNNSHNGIKSSLLSRARNSTINLASLATVGQRFNCSASVGNLWSSGSQQQRRELAQLSGESENVKPLEYVASAHFDHYVSSKAEAEAKQQQQQDASGKPSSDSKKSKKKRQKEAEKIEKLRMLVSYLKSGTSQKFLNPVALEADELELAQRYKMHLILCDDCLQNAEMQADALESSHSSPNLIHLAAGNGTNNIATNASKHSLSPPLFSSSPLTVNHHHHHHHHHLHSPGSQINANDTDSGIVINVRRSSDQTPQQAPSPLSLSSSCLTNPQNLATWIDNEVNSLVNDLEAKSQSILNNNNNIKEKPAKSSKLKWLSSSSTSSNNNRRNSSGAHST